MRLGSRGTGARRFPGAGRWGCDSTDVLGRPPVRPGPGSQPGVPARVRLNPRPSKSPVRPVRSGVPARGPGPRFTSTPDPSSHHSLPSPQVAIRTLVPQVGTPPKTHPQVAIRTPPWFRAQRSQTDRVLGTTLQDGHNVRRPTVFWAQRSQKAL